MRVFTFKDILEEVLPKLTEQIDKQLAQPNDPEAKKKLDELSEVQSVSR
jgi:hypothetical protein